MRFSLTGDQIALRDAVHELLADTPPEMAWDGLARMGVCGALVPEADGGLGLSDVDLVPIFMEVGYAAVPGPVAETVLAAPLVPPQRRPDVVRGALKVAVAGADGLVAFDSDLVLVVSRPSPERPAGAAPLAGAVRPVGAVRLVVPGPATSESTVDATRPLRRPALPAGGVVAADADLVRRRIDLAAAAQLIGLGRRMLDLTTDYARTRHQFGVPIGSFQAVKHQCADALLALEFAAPAVFAAAWALGNRTGEAGRAVSMAAVLAAEAATRTARVAIQCHGAIGYTVEYALHRFAKRAWALAATIDIDEHLDHIAASLSLKEVSP